MITPTRGMAFGCCARRMPATSNAMTIATKNISRLKGSTLLDWTVGNTGSSLSKEGDGWTVGTLSAKGRLGRRFGTPSAKEGDGSACWIARVRMRSPVEISVLVGSPRFGRRIT